MPNLITIFDDGITNIEVNGYPVKFGVLRFRASQNESAPVDYIAHYRYHYRESIIKSLNRLAFQKPKTEEPKPDATNAEPPPNENPMP